MITGILTPHMVPLDAGGRIAEAELERYVSWLVERGVHGLYPNGSTGEFLRFTADERRRIVEIVCRAAAGRVPVVAGAAEGTAAETIRACEHCHEAGATAVAIVSPFYYKLSQESILAYFREIARHSPIDITLYNIPMLASPMEVATVQRLAEECPRIVGIKDSSGDVAWMARAIAAVRPTRPEFSFLTGWDAALVAMLAIGCNGGTNASSGVVPELTRAIYDAVRGGDLPRANRLQAALTGLFDPMLSGADFPEGFRIAAGLRGFAMGPSRQPASEGQIASRRTLAEDLRARLEELGMDGDRPGQPIGI